MKHGQRWELNQGCVTAAITLQKRYSALQDHESCVTASIQAEEKDLNINESLGGGQSPRVWFCLHKIFPGRSVFDVDRYDSVRSHSVALMSFD